MMENGSLKLLWGGKTIEKPLWVAPTPAVSWWHLIFPVFSSHFTLAVFNQGAVWGWMFLCHLDSDNLSFFFPLKYIKDYPAITSPHELQHLPPSRSTKPSPKNSPPINSLIWSLLRKVCWITQFWPSIMSGATDTELMSGGLRKKEKKSPVTGSEYFGS